MFAFLFCMLFSILNILCFGILLCTVSLLYIVFFFLIIYNFIYHCHLVETQLKSINITPKATQPHAWRLLPLVFFRITPFDHILCPNVFKTQIIWTPIAMQFKQKERLTTWSVSISCQFSYLYRHTKNHIVSTLNNVQYVTKWGGGGESKKA
jgi:hypothetical protein